jgi:hypothetical protein
MPETTQPAPAQTSELRTCCACGASLIGGTAVSILEKGTGPSRILYACSPCLKRKDLVPLDEQDAPVGDGRLVFRAQ